MSQISQEDNFARVSFLIKLQAENILKANKKATVLDSCLLQSYKQKKFARKHQCRSLVFNKVPDYRHNINIKLLIQLHFFIAPLITKPS